MELTRILKDYHGPATGLTLDYEHRQRSRLRVRLDDGRVAALMLPRGTMLQHGDCLRGSDGRVVRVQAAPEAVSTVAITDPILLARAAYHLGNRHEPVQLGDGWLRYRRDHVLDAMLHEHGLDPRHEQAPFEPERGAYHSNESKESESFDSRIVVDHRDHRAESNDAAPFDSTRLQLLRLASPTLPIGSFAYSQGLEQAIELGWITDETSTADWLLGLLSHVQPCQEVPLFARLYRAWADGDAARVADWNSRVLALRETAELRAEERNTGASLARLLIDLGMTEPDLQGHGYLSAFACAAVRWDIALPDAAGGLLWSWCHNQVAAAIRLVPLGQTAGQRILARLIEAIPAQIERGLGLDDAEIGFTAPGLAIASARHEHQYTRLFLS